MSFIHYLFLGHFEHDGKVSCFSKNPSGTAFRPVVRRPLDTDVIVSILREATGSECRELAFPEDWMVWMDDGYLVCDKYMRNRKAIDFVVRLVEQTKCDIHDVSVHCDITLDDWLAITRSYAQS